MKPTQSPLFLKEYEDFQKDVYYGRIRRECTAEEYARNRGIINHVEETVSLASADALEADEMKESIRSGYGHPSVWSMVKCPACGDVAMYEFSYIIGSFLLESQIAKCRKCGHIYYAADGIVTRQPQGSCLVSALMAVVFLFILPFNAMAHAGLAWWQAWGGSLILLFVASEIRVRVRRAVHRSA